MQEFQNVEKRLELVWKEDALKNKQVYFLHQEPLNGVREKQQKSQKNMQKLIPFSKLEFRTGRVSFISGRVIDLVLPAGYTVTRVMHRSMLHKLSISGQK